MFWAYELLQKFAKTLDEGENEVLWLLVQAIDIEARLDTLRQVMYGLHKIEGKTAIPSVLYEFLNDMRERLEEEREFIAIKDPTITDIFEKLERRLEKWQ